MAPKKAALCNQKYNEYIIWPKVKIKLYTIASCMSLIIIIFEAKSLIRKFSYALQVQ